MKVTKAAVKRNQLRQIPVELLFLANEAVVALMEWQILQKLFSADDLERGALMRAIVILPQKQDKIAAERLSW